MLIMPLKMERTLDDMKSILQSKKECLICATDLDLHLHHVFGGYGKRTISDREGLVVYLCPYHHNASKNSVHLNRKLDLKVKRWAEKKWLEHNNKTIDDFIELMGKNYLEREGE